MEQSPDIASRALGPHIAWAQGPYLDARAAHILPGRYAFAPQPPASLPATFLRRPPGTPVAVAHHRQVPPTVEVTAARPCRPPEGAVGSDDGKAGLGQHQPIEKLCRGGAEEGGVDEHDGGERRYW